MKIQLAAATRLAANKFRKLTGKYEVNGLSFTVTDVSEWLRFSFPSVSKTSSIDERSQVAAVKAWMRQHSVKAADLPADVAQHNESSFKSVIEEHNRTKTHVVYLYVGS